MNNSHCELVSVIIPTRNRVVRLGRAIESVLSQSWPNIEIIVIDDASSDETPRYLENLLESTPNIIVIRNEIPLGGAGARNAGVSAATGNYVAFLDDDDVWMSTKIEQQMSLIVGKPEVAAVSCWFYIDEEKHRRRLIRLFSPKDKQKILTSNHLGGASMCLTTKQSFVRIGGFDAGLKSGQDWDLWIKLFDIGRIEMCRNPLVCYLPHTGERITSNLKAVYQGRRRIFRRYRFSMEKKARQTHLAELLYSRKVNLVVGLFQQLTGLISVYIFAGVFAGNRYIYRYIKSLIS